LPDNVGHHGHHKVFLLFVASGEGVLLSRGFGRGGVFHLWVSEDGGMFFGREFVQVKRLSIK